MTERTANEGPPITEPAQWTKVSVIGWNDSGRRKVDAVTDSPVKK